MVFNDTTNNQGLVQEINWWAGTNDDTYTLQDKTRNTNRALDAIGARIIKNSYRWTFIDDNSGDFYIANTTITANVDNIALEVTHLNLERVRIKVQDSWKTLTPKSRREISDDDLDRTAVPEYYYRQGQSLVFAPVPIESYEVEVEFQKGLDYFTPTDTTKEPGFNPQFHRLVALYAARDYVAINDQSRYTVVQNEIEKMEREMELFYQTRTRDEVTHLKLNKSPHRYII